MPGDDTKESKAKKLAAARRKLKEYQKRGMEGTLSTNGISTLQEQGTSTTSVSSTLSERSDSEQNLNGSALAIAAEYVSNDSAASTPPPSTGNSSQVIMVDRDATVTPAVESSSIAAPTAAKYFDTPPQPTLTGEPTGTADAINIFYDQLPSDFGAHQSISAIQVLIAEKAQLTTELTKCRTVNREKDLELEELRTQYINATRRLDELQQSFLSQQQSMEQCRNTNTDLQHKVDEAVARWDDQTAQVQELKKQLIISQTRASALEEKLKEQSNELELAQIRIHQLSDESNINKDDRVESLTQTKFMYEQQIRDLQAIVQQLRQDKEQKNTQYQTYVQLLNTEVANLNERNAELTDECTKLEARERQLVEHVGCLERDIQKNISRQDQLRDKEAQNQLEGEKSSASMEKTSMSKMEEKISDLEFERHEFQLKIKSQEDRLESLTYMLQKQNSELELAQQRLEQVSATQPDSTKLLATMESDKVAASRALSQNVELKKQLDELELRFVQLTNDKADLTNKLDAEEFANREIRFNYNAMEEKLHNMDQRFKFKDDEMIRLSHENMELKHANLILRQQIDRLQHYQAEGYNNDYGGQNNNIDQTSETRNVQDLDKHEHQGNYHEHHNHTHSTNSNEISVDVCQEAQEIADVIDAHSHVLEPKYDQNVEQHSCATPTPHIPTREAVEKLQQRFTKLMSQVADLTEEKQKLEHLVLQLQGETETIGEYITLYQTQRRMLKQREYEKAAQMQLLQADREEMRKKIAILNSLVSRLDVELPSPSDSALAESTVEFKRSMQQNLSATFTTAQGENDAPTNDENEVAEQQSNKQTADSFVAEKIHSTEAQQILNKIQTIITEIRENTMEVPMVPTVDHLNCCLGKFEVV